MAEQQRLSPSGLQSMLTALVRTAQDGKMPMQAYCAWLLQTYNTQSSGKVEGISTWPTTVQASVVFLVSPCMGCVCLVAC